MSDDWLQRGDSLFALGDVVVLVVWALLHLKAWWRDRSLRPDLKDGAFLLALGACALGGHMTSAALRERDAARTAPRWLTFDQIQTIQRTLKSSTVAKPGDHVSVYFNVDGDENALIEQTTYGDQIVEVLANVGWSSTKLGRLHATELAKYNGLVLLTTPAAPAAAKELANALGKARVDWQWQPREDTDQSPDDVRIIVGAKGQYPW